jgi:hypothetical protein
MASRLFSVILRVTHFRGWFAAIIALAPSVHVNAQPQPPATPADAQRFTDATTKLIAAINADDQAAIQQMFNGTMQEALPAEKTGPFFRGVLSAKGKLQAAGAPDMNGPTAKLRVTAERGDWQFEITLDPSDKIAGLLVVPAIDRPGRAEGPLSATTQPSQEERTYFELRRSDDRLTRQIAERYFNLVKLQEWSDATGKFKTNAKYVSHTPDQRMVTLSMVPRRGASPIVKEIPVERLSRTCQSRVKQIATLQKRLDERAADADPGGPGAPMTDERGVDPRGPEFSGIDQPAGANPISAEFGGEPVSAASSLPPSPVEGESEPDPLGFGELPPAPAANAAAFDVIVPAAEANAADPPPVDRLTIPGATPAGTVGPRDEFELGEGDPVQWQKSYADFRENFLVDASSGHVDWKNLDALRIMGEAAAPGITGPEAEAAQQRAASLAASLGEVRWEATFLAMQPAEGHVLILFDVPPLPMPIQIEFWLEQRDRATAAEWPQFSRGDRVSFTGRLAMNGPTAIVVNVRDPKLVQGAPSKPNR